MSIEDFIIEQDTNRAILADIAEGLDFKTQLSDDMLSIFNDNIGIQVIVEEGVVLHQRYLMGDKVHVAELADPDSKSKTIKYVNKILRRTSIKTT